MEYDCFINKISIDLNRNPTLNQSFERIQRKRIFIGLKFKNKKQTISKVFHKINLYDKID